MIRYIERAGPPWLRRLRGLVLAALLALIAPTAWANNPGDPLYCQPQEGANFLITNSGSDVWTVDPDCFGNFVPSVPAALSTQTPITGSAGGTLTLTVTPSGGNYTYTPPSPGFVGTDSFNYNVTTVWNSAGGTGSNGGTSRPGGPATMTITLNVLPSATAMTVVNDWSDHAVPVPAGSITGCAANQGSPGAGPPAGVVGGCTTAVSNLPPLGTPLATAPLHGTVSRSGTTGLVYTPFHGYVGSDTFNYYVLGVNTDGSRALSSGQVTMTVTVTAPSTDATLSSLACSGAALSPAFAPGTTDYATTVAYGVNAVSVTPTTNGPAASVAVNGTALSSGSASGLIPLAVGSNTITVVVTAQDHVTTRTYTMYVTRADPLTTLGLLNPQAPTLMSAPAMLDVGGSIGNDLLQRIAAILGNTTGVPWTVAGQAPTGAITFNGNAGSSLVFTILGQPASTGQADGLYPMGDGTYSLVTRGFAVVLAPIPTDLAQLGTLLLPDGTLRMNGAGVLTATLGGVTYVAQPSYFMRPGTGATTPRIVVGTDGRLHFIDALGDDQILYPAFADPLTLQIDVQSLSLLDYVEPQIDGTLRAWLSGSVYTFTPDLTLGTMPSGRGGQAWWQDSANHFTVVNGTPPGTTQGFTVGP